MLRSGTQRVGAGLQARAGRAGLDPKWKIVGLIRPLPDDDALRVFVLLRQINKRLALRSRVVGQIEQRSAASCSVRIGRTAGNIVGPQKSLARFVAHQEVESGFTSFLVNGVIGPVLRKTV